MCGEHRWRGKFPLNIKHIPKQELLPIQSKCRSALPREVVGAHPWIYSKWGSRELWVAWPSWGCPCFLQRGWTRRPSGVTCNPKHSMTSTLCVDTELISLEKLLGDNSSFWTICWLCDERKHVAPWPLAHKRTSCKDYTWALGHMVCRLIVRTYHSLDSYFPVKLVEMSH